MANPVTGCRCGSGGHPRRCEIHPFSFDEHVAEMNFWDALHDDDPDEPWPEHMAEVRRRHEVWEKANRAVLKHRNEEEDRLRAAIAERDARIRELEEALGPVASLYEAEKDEGCGVTHYGGLPIEVVRGAAAALSRKGTP